MKQKRSMNEALIAAKELRKKLASPPALPESDQDNWQTIGRDKWRDSLDLTVSSSTDGLSSEPFFLVR